MVSFRLSFDDANPGVRFVEGKVPTPRYISGGVLAAFEPVYIEKSVGS
jgi:hypothetical protein